MKYIHLGVAFNLGFIRDHKAVGDKRGNKRNAPESVSFIV
jgi:hypothetical protein